MSDELVYKQFHTWLSDKSISLSDEQWGQFQLYYELLVEWNERMNLTAIVDREQVFLKHFFDSISLSFFHPLHSVQTLADIGSGAGFPSIPLKILFPHLQVTIVDSLNKRIHFLEHLADQLKLSNVRCKHGRAEDLARDPQLRDQFDLVTARAVARLPLLNELCLPFVAVRGHFVAMKGADPSDEIKEARFSLAELKGELKQVHSWQLPVESSERHLIVIEKRGSTPRKYPRKAGTPAKTPLVARS